MDTSNKNEEQYIGGIDPYNLEENSKASLFKVNHFEKGIENFLNKNPKEFPKIWNEELLEELRNYYKADNPLFLIEVTNDSLIKFGFEDSTITEQLSEGQSAIKELDLMDNDSSHKEAYIYRKMRYNKKYYAHIHKVEERFNGQLKREITWIEIDVLSKDNKAYPHYCGKINNEYELEMILKNLDLL